VTAVLEIAVAGAGGRLGRRIIALASRSGDVKVAAALEAPGSPLEGKDAGLLAGEGELGIAVSTNARRAIRPGVVLIEAATRQSALEHAELAADAKAPILVATTGFAPQERKALESYADRVPVLITANLSLGVTVLTDLVAKASRALAAYHLEIVELHHAKKKDAPSGTAWQLARAAAEARGQDIERDAICARAGEIGARGEKEIGLQAVRGGDIVGEHTVYFIGETERLELVHRAQSRDAFAHGAVSAARFLGAPERRPGLYSMRDVLGL
jgi:4-hydroxy-tetrahydrodipicolinate reductase